MLGSDIDMINVDVWLRAANNQVLRDKVHSQFAPVEYKKAV